MESRQGVKKDEQVGAAEQKLRLLLDKLHGEDTDIHDKLIEFLSERCKVTVLKKKLLEKKKPLDLNLLIENDVFMLISPNKTWDKSDIETVRRYVETYSGILVAVTLDGRKPEHLNKLLEPYGFSVIRGTVGEKHLDRDSLEGSQLLLETIETLALGTVCLYESTRIAESNEAEVLLQYKDAILGAKRSLGKGTAYLFSCLPIFGNKQLDNADNKMFLNNLLKCLVTPAMTATLDVILKDEALAEQAIATYKALAAQEIVGFICTRRSEDLFFTSDRVIVAKKGSIAKFFGWGFVGSIADEIYKGSKAKKLSELSPDKILRDNKRNFIIHYDEISKIDMRKNLLGVVEITINTSTDKYSFYWDLGTDDLKKRTSFLVPLLADKLSIRD